MLERAVIVAMIVVAIHAVFLKEMIFGFVRNIKMPEWISKPWYDCPVCMTAWWGSAAYWVFFDVGWLDFLAVIVSAMGINYIVSLILPDE